MKSLVRFTFIYLCLVFSVLAQDHSQQAAAAASDEKHEHQGDLYTCPMHPEVRRDKPGLCPICHMPLVKVGLEIESDPKVQSKLSDRASVALKQGEEELLNLSFQDIELKPLETQVLSSGRALSRARVYLQVPESDVSAIKVGARVVLESPSLGTQKELGVIRSIDSQLEPTTRTLRVIVEVLTTSAPHLMPESTVMARIEVRKGEGLWIPESALVRSADRSYVFVLKESTLVPTEVALGPRVGAGFELVSGLEAGAKVLTQGTFLIDSESRLRSR